MKKKPWSVHMDSLHIEEILLYRVLPWATHKQWPMTKKLAEKYKISGIHMVLLFKIVQNNVAHAVFRMKFIYVK